MSDDRTPGGFRGWLASNQGVGTCVVVVAGVLLWAIAGQDWFDNEQRDGFTLGFFPALGLIAIIVTALILVLDRSRKVVVEEMREVGLVQIVLAVAASLAAYAMFTLMPLLGLPLASAVFLFAAMPSLGLRPWYLCLGLSVGISLLIFVVFTILGIRLPGGALPLMG